MSMMNNDFYTVGQLSQATKQTEVKIRWDILTNKLKAQRLPSEAYGFFAVPEKDAKHYILIHKKKDEKVQQK